MLPLFIRILTTTISVVGLGLLARTIFMAFDGSLMIKYFPNAICDLRTTIYALGLALPIPLHVIAIGLILQRKWLSPGWAYFARIAIVTSGLWLGIALLVRMFIDN